MSQNNTNRDIRRFETDADGNTTRVLLNTDEPLGLLDGDYQEQLEELQNRLNAITGGAYSNTVQIAHGGTGAESAKAAMTNLVAALDFISQSDNNSYAFVAKRTGGTGSGNVYTLAQGAVAEQIGALKASNNLSDIGNASNALGNLIYNSNDISDTVTSFDSIDDEMLPLQTYGGYSKFTNKITIGKLVDLFKGIFLQKNNNLSDLASTSIALYNIFDGVSDMPELLNGGSRIFVTSDGIPTTPVAGKATINHLFNNVLIGKINTEYGMSKNAGTGLYDFTGNAATADVAIRSLGLSMFGGSSNMGLKAVVSPLQTLQGDGTVVFSSSNDDFGTEDVILGFRIVIEGAGGAVIKSFTQERTKSAQSNGSLTVTVDVTGNTVGPGNPSSFYVYCYYLHSLNA